MKNAKHSRALKFVIIIVVVFVCASSSGVRSERLPLRIYTSADGLGSSFINYLMRDSRGFLWICTRDGLTRFDGNKFTTYQVGDSTGIEQIVESRKGIYWIVTTLGLFKFDPADSTPYSDSDGSRLNVKFVTKDRSFLLEDRDGNLWSGRDALYLLKENGDSLSSQKIELNLPTNYDVDFGINRMIESRDRSLWLLTTWGLVRLLPDGRRVFYQVNATQLNYLTSALEDSEGRIWIGSFGGIYVLKPERADQLPQIKDLKLDRVARSIAAATTENTNLMELPKMPGDIVKHQVGRGVAPDFITSVFQTSDGHIWISGLRNLVEITGDRFKTYAAQEQIRGTISSEDDRHSLWIGTSSGLVKLNRDGLTSFLTADGLAANSVASIGETHDGKLMVVDSEFRVNVLIDDRFLSTRPTLPPESAALWTSNPGFQDSAGEWWFLTRGKLYRYQASSDHQTLSREQPKAVYDRNDGLAGSSMFHMFEDSNRDLWISTRDAIGLTRWNRKSETFQTLSQGDGLPPDKIVSSFAEDRSGNRWFGFSTGGLVRFTNGRFTEFKTEEGAPSGLITALHIDPSGKLWIASSQDGVTMVADPSAIKPEFVTFTKEKGLTSNNVRALTSDLSGNIYLGTASGVDRLSADGKRVKHYSVDDGLAGDFVNTAFRDRAGNLWFGTVSGLSRLILSRADMAKAPAVFISGLRIGGQRHQVPILGSAEISVPEISHSQNNVQIDFFSIDFSAGRSLKYQYKLESADRDWSPPTDQSSIAFANLQPGTYRFLVRAIGLDGLPSEQPATVSFRILAPIWQRWWFIALTVLFATSVLLLIYRYRVAHLRQVNEALRQANLAEERLHKANEERLRELERVRKRIATDLHDDIGSSLTRISLLSEVAQRQSAVGTPRPDGPLAVVAGLSRELVDSMSDIVWAINPERDSLGDLMQRMRRFASDVFSAKGIEFQFVLPESERELKLGANLRRELFLIFKEGVNNAVRHSGCTEARVELHVDSASLLLKLIDNGHGFDVVEKSNGHGLSSMRARTEGLGGKFEVIRSKGTTLSFTIPL